MTYRNRIMPRTQEQADAWAEELDNFLTNGSSQRILNKRQMQIVAQELDRWIAHTKTVRKLQWLRINNFL